MGEPETTTGVPLRPPSSTHITETPVIAPESDVAGSDNVSNDNQCAGVLHGGVDDISPLKIWDTIMKRYKVAQDCDREIAKLDAKSTHSEKEELLRKRVSRCIFNFC